jgi:hypothetical protein
MRKILVLFLAMGIALGLFAAPALTAPTQGTTASKKESGEARVSGTIARSSPDKSTLTVKEHKSNIEKTVIYNSSTKWTKGKEAVDMKQFKDGSRVVCVGHLDEKGELTATRCDLQ